MIENLEIKKTNEKDAALMIGKSLPASFTPEGLVSLESDLNAQTVYGAFLADRMVGFICLRKADIGSLEISWLAVSPELQGKGVGTKLVKESLREMTHDGIEVCYVKTLAETSDDKGYALTRSFYKALGFYTLEIIDPYPTWEQGNPCQLLAARLPLRN